MKCKILIVDDEHLARLRIRSYLEKKYPEISVTEAEDGVEGLEAIAASTPDIVFLDIDMPELTGFEMLKQLESRPFKVIFQTAYDQFAIKAFEECACDYLLKPFTDERLEASLKRASSEFASTGTLEKLDHHLQDQNIYLTKLVVDVGSRKKIISESEILYIWSEEHITRIFLETIDFAYSRSLNFLEEHLNPRIFHRIHRNCILNTNALSEIRKDGSTGIALLKNGKELQISRERYKSLKALFET